MAEARVQGLDMSKVAVELHVAVPDAVVASQNAAAIEGLYVSQLLTPFDETDVPGVKLYREGVTNDQDVSANGETAYAAALAFEDLVEQDRHQGQHQRAHPAVAPRPAQHRIRRSTRKGILDASEVLGQPSPCWVTVQVQSGKFVRVDPEGVGKFTCDPNAIVQVTGNFNG